MTELYDKAFGSIFATNVQGLSWLINRVTPQISQNGSGAIILRSSIAGLLRSKNIGAYAVSKALDVQLAKNYEVELGPDNIRVNAISPGLIRTESSRAFKAF